jgi:hypothetical protein
VFGPDSNEREGFKLKLWWDVLLVKNDKINYHFYLNTVTFYNLLCRNTMELGLAKWNLVEEYSSLLIFYYPALEHFISLVFRPFIKLILAHFTGCFTIWLQHTIYHALRSKFNLLSHYNLQIFQHLHFIRFNLFHIFYFYFLNITFSASIL